ncbi:plus-3-domain-containing protein [Rickenella mellea]|uniref:Plus-3-domain-containing protein n=1 Tax=Rickenella mellea TaxID=50990 RepID=A0A4Y7QKU5_9AGAM|nr:plus-3-domain-containing protein [Rickenella mellea]
MSDSEGDFSDELLELAGATEKKRKSKSAKASGSGSNKRRKAELTSLESTDNEPESEEDDSNPYPLEGKYTDEADRQKLLEMSEIDREDVLAQRQEELQRIQDKRNLDQMLKAQRGEIDDSVSKAAKRAHAQRGATKEKSRKLDELKARRKLKDEKKRTKASSPKRDRSSSPMDMEMSSDDEEDGQISKLEQEEEREARLIGKTKVDDGPTTLADLETCRLGREQLSKYCMAPWFEEYVKGAWVRYLIGQETNGQPVYRICEVINVFPKGLGADLVKPYKLNNQTVNQQLELKHGDAVKLFPMDKVSNSLFPQREFDRLVKVCEANKIKLPSKRTLEKKAAQMATLTTQRLTETDISAMLARKNLLSTNRPSASNSTLERSRLQQARTLAMRRHDFKELEEIDKAIAALAAPAPQDGVRKDELADALAKVNERNRKANMEAVRKAEALETERKRRERKLLAATRSSTPVNAAGKLLDPASRAGTPLLGTPRLAASAATPGRSVSPLPMHKKAFESDIVKSIEVDLGDF